jgi:hypothetical protein
MESRIDPHTGKYFVPKRNNQQFATRENQVAFNNIKARLIRDSHVEIDKKIKQNSKILENLLIDSDKVVKSKDFFEGVGYNFPFFNNYRTHKGITYECVYNIGIRGVGVNDIEAIRFINPNH